MFLFTVNAKLRRAQQDVAVQLVENCGHRSADIKLLQGSTSK
jgi:hypothetical protein